MRRSLLAAAAAVVVAAGALIGSAAPAQADRWDDYRDYRRYTYYRGLDPGEVHRRTIVRERMLDLADRVRLLAREDALSPRAADHLWDRLDRVRDFLRHDRYLDPDEYRRRMRDLDRVEDAVHDASRRLHRDRYRDDRGDRYRDRDDR